MTQATNFTITPPSTIALAALEKGHVWLVGAGPGDPGLMRLYCVHALRSADYILYDALVNESCLAYAQPKARLEFSGKRAQKQSCRQKDIIARMIDLARQNFRVVRLKGGDPFFFGRGGEEALALKEAQIPFRIVPGISAGLAGLAYAGMPITHRDSNQNILFLTGHDAKGQLPNFDWVSIAKASPVLVFYMATRFIQEIAKHLLEAGRDATESVAFISHATTEKQKIKRTCLGEILLNPLPSTIETPCIIVIGPIVDFCPILSWFEESYQEG